MGDQSNEHGLQFKCWQIASSSKYFDVAFDTLAKDTVTLGTVDEFSDILINQIDDSKRRCKLLSTARTSNFFPNSFLEFLYQTKKK